MAKRIAPHQVRDPKRAAVPSLRGYRYQLLHAVQRCLELDGTTLLVVEGNEDIDLIGLGADRAAVEEQVKLRSETLEWSSVTNVLLHFAVAFKCHHQERRTFSAILRTNVEIADGPDCSIRRWIERRRVSKRSILKELRQVARTSGTATQKAAVAYIARCAGIEKFIDAVEWAVSAPGPEQIEANLCVRDAARQARHRWEMSIVDVPTETARVAQDVLTHMLPDTRVRVDDESDLPSSTLVHTVAKRCGQRRLNRPIGAPGRSDRG